MTDVESKIQSLDAGMEQPLLLRKRSSSDSKLNEQVAKPEKKRDANMVQVVCRFRPENEAEMKAGAKTIVDFGDSDTVVTLDSKNEGAGPKKFEVSLTCPHALCCCCLAAICRRCITDCVFLRILASLIQSRASLLFSFILSVLSTTACSGPTRRSKRCSRAWASRLSSLLWAASTPRSLRTGRQVRAVLVQLMCFWVAIVQALGAVAVTAHLALHSQHMLPRAHSSRHLRVRLTSRLAAFAGSGKTYTMLGPGFDGADGDRVHTPSQPAHRAGRCVVSSMRNRFRCDLICTDGCSAR
jgi:hypothetical protein